MIELARQMAMTIPYEKGKHRVYAIISDKKGRILSESPNMYNKSSPVMKKFAELVGEKNRIFWHAECRAIYRIPRGQKPFKISIARINQKGQLLPSAPCIVCENAIRNSGIKVVEYHI